MATSKHTYIFRANDPELSDARLQKLVNVLKRTTTVSWKYEGDADRLTSVQCFVDGPSVYNLLSRAGIRPDAWDVIVKQARRLGDAATSEAAKRLDDLRVEGRMTLKVTLTTIEGHYRHAAGPETFTGIHYVEIKAGRMFFETDNYDNGFSVSVREIEAVRIESEVQPAPTAVGSPQMGSTPATRRSKRSA